MSLNTLTGNSLSATRSQILHIGTGTLAAGAVIRLGDGTTTPLTISATGIAIAGTVTATTVTTSTSVTTPVLILGGVTMAPTVWKVMAANVLATDTTLVALPALSFTPVNGAKYAVKMLLFITSAATAGAAQITNTGGAGTLYLLDPQTALGITATGGSYSPTTSPVAGTWALTLEGIFIASSTADLTFSIKSDDTNDVTALLGSYISFTKLP